MSPTPSFRSVARSDPGTRRRTNEDRYLHCPDEGFFAVIDGVGGYAGGEVAAEEACQALKRRLQYRTGSPAVRLREAVVLANNHIYRRAQQEPERAEMACVLTALLLEDGKACAAHVGDTRLYKIHDGVILKLTHDHSFVGLREDAGHLSERQAMQHPRRNEILRDVGSGIQSVESPSFVDYVETAFEEDCALLLCSDGLTDLVTESDVLQAILEHAGNPEAAADRLIHLAKQAGGTDNITVVLIEGEAHGKPR